MIENNIISIKAKVRIFIFTLVLVLFIFLVFLELCFGYFSLFIFLILIMILFIVFLNFIILSNFWNVGILNGLKIIQLHFRLERELIDAGIYFKRKIFSNNELIVSLPNYKFSFDSSFETGILKIRSSVKFHKKFSDFILDSALGDFISDYQFFSDDNCYLMIKLVNVKLERKFRFNSPSEMIKEIRNNNNCVNSLLIDRRVKVPFSSILLNGQTGTGKSYFLYNLIIQLLFSKSKVYIIDPKNSSLARIGDLMDNNSCAIYSKEIFDLIKHFRKLMEIRKKEISKKLINGLEFDYFDFGYKAHFLIIDEFATVKGFLDLESRDIQKEIWADLTAIVTQGRSLGFFVCISLQKTDSSTINLIIRDNLPLKIVMGNSDSTTYFTAFGCNIDLKKQYFNIGEGLYKSPGIVEPRKIYISELNFDIYHFLKKLIIYQNQN